MIGSGQKLDDFWLLLQVLNSRVKNLFCSFLHCSILPPGMMIIEPNDRLYQYLYYGQRFCVAKSRFSGCKVSIYTPIRFIFYNFKQQLKMISSHQGSRFILSYLSLSPSDKSRSASVLFFSIELCVRRLFIISILYIRSKYSIYIIHR